MPRLPTRISPGLDGSAAKTGISGTLLNQLTQMDGFIHVVRCFEDENMPHPSGSVDPARDILAMDSEFLLNDLIAVERKLEKLNEERKKGAGRDKGIIEREIVFFNRLNEALGEEIPLRDLDISTEEDKMTAGFGFLSLKAHFGGFQSGGRPTGAGNRVCTQTQPDGGPAGQAGNGNRPAAPGRNEDVPG